MKHKLPTPTRAIITGASSGIGRALALMLASEFKAKLVLNARNAELLSETAEFVKQAGGIAVVEPGDVADKKVAPRLAQRCLDEFGGIDLLVNNAGLTRGGTLTDLSPEDWEFVFGVNFFGALYASYAVLPHMLSAGKGKIVNVASIAGKVALPGSVCYAASKFAMTGMSEGMAAELSRKDIDVITMCPGLVRTEFFENNNIMKRTSPTAVAEQGDFRGWFARNIVSISSEDVARAIIRACQKGGYQEIVMTIPGVVLDRVSGVWPSLGFYLASKINPRRAIVQPRNTVDIK